MTFVPSADVEAIRGRLDHPDHRQRRPSHRVPAARARLPRRRGGAECGAGVRPIVKSALPRVSVPDPAPRRQLGIHVVGIWGLPDAQHARPRDRHAARPHVPAARRARHRLRRALPDVRAARDRPRRHRAARACSPRALNRYYAEVYADYRDRLEPVGSDPDAHARGGDRRARPRGRGARAQDDHVRRPDPAALRRRAGQRGVVWIDSLGHDSLYDYDPLWRRCEELGVAPTFHSGGQGWGTRMSTDQLRRTTRSATSPPPSEGTCRSLFFGGVPDAVPGAALRVPGRRRGVGVRAARGPRRPLGEAQPIDAIQHYNPAAPRPATCWRRLFDEHATGRHRRPARPARRSPRACCSDPDELRRRRPVRRVAAHQCRRPVRHVHQPVLLRVRSRRSHERPRFSPALNARRRHDCPPSSPPTSATGTCATSARCSSRRTSWSTTASSTKRSSGPSCSSNPVRLWAGANPDFFHGTVVESAVAKAVA